MKSRIEATPAMTLRRAAERYVRTIKAIEAQRASDPMAAARRLQKAETALVDAAVALREREAETPIPAAVAIEWLAALDVPGFSSRTLAGRVRRHARET